ncbi:hypothetical protein MMPV_001299 [Pyropia vietnamensis]
MATRPRSAARRVTAEVPSVGGAAAGMTRVVVHISGERLADRDVMSKSDPFAVLYIRAARQSKYVELGRTETLKDTVNPRFVSSFELPYAFEQLQELRVAVYDRDSPSSDLRKHDFIGAAECALAQIVTSPGRCIKLNLVNAAARRRQCGFVSLTGEEVSTTKKMVYMDLGLRLAQRASDNVRRYFVISRQRDGGGGTIDVYRSEATRCADRRMRFKSVFVDGETLTRGDDHRELTIRFMEDRGRSQDAHRLHSEITTCFAELVGLDVGSELAVGVYNAPKGTATRRLGGLFSRKHSTDKGVGSSSSTLTGTASGVAGVSGGGSLSSGVTTPNGDTGAASVGHAAAIATDSHTDFTPVGSAAAVGGAAAGEFVKTGAMTVYGVREIKEPSFLDFVAGGCRIRLAIGVDFTSSNGDAHADPTSLHYVGGTEPNDYEWTLRSVVDILSAYVHEQVFACYGFGARVPPDYYVSHCFPLGAGDGPEAALCQGIEGVLEAYRRTLDEVQLYGPTVFADLVRHVATLASGRVTQTDQQYTILLVLTDGVVSDMRETIAEVVGASVLPLSIIIVGIGDEDFSRMAILDSDDRLLRSGERVAARDIVQFCAVRDAKRDPRALAAAVLAEVPTQLTGFMKANRIKPNLPIPDMSSAGDNVGGRSMGGGGVGGGGGSGAPPTATGRGAAIAAAAVGGAIPDLIGNDPVATAHAVAPGFVADHLKRQEQLMERERREQAVAAAAAAATAATAAESQARLQQQQQQQQQQQLAQQQHQQQLAHQQQLVMHQAAHQQHHAQHPHDGQEASSVSSQQEELERLEQLEAERLAYMEQVREEEQSGGGGGVGGSGDAGGGSVLSGGGGPVGSMPSGHAGAFDFSELQSTWSGESGFAATPTLKRRDAAHMSPHAVPHGSSGPFVSSRAGSGGVFGGASLAPGAVAGAHQGGRGHLPRQMPLYCPEDDVPPTAGGGHPTHRGSHPPHGGQGPPGAGVLPPFYPEDDLPVGGAGGHGSARAARDSGAGGSRAGPARRSGRTRSVGLDLSTVSRPPDAVGGGGSHQPRSPVVMAAAAASAVAAAAATGGNGVRQWSRPRTPDVHGGGGTHDRDEGGRVSHGRHALARLPTEGLNYGGCGGGYMPYSPVGSSPPPPPPPIPVGVSPSSEAGVRGSGGTPAPLVYPADRGPSGRGSGPPSHLAGARGGGADRHGRDVPPAQSSWDGAAAANWKASQPTHRTGWG